ncbi:uncharacterized protein LOC129600525 [Paramacrobiotus metropolitanus]|uniref:uncharacterized protein LOC129600525 n=1 Tax=Paramacrobiotus metropolitanus TaxID=2943436 RepID=UPI00244586F7|nr:uncharacterized protein LOC129600525 [Paramacrobiotus metropolitanus]
MDKDKEQPTSTSSQGSISSRSSQQGAPNPYKKDLHTYSRPVGHERNTRAPKAFEKKDSRGSDSTYQKALEAVANQESSSDDQKYTPASTTGSEPMNQTKVAGEDRTTEKTAEAEGASQLDATISGTNEQDKNVNLAQAEWEKTKVTEEELAELRLDDLTLNDRTNGDDLWATPMVSDESNESYYTDDETTINTSFRTAMKEADRAEGMTSFTDIPEHLIERTQTGKVINVRSPSPNSPTTTLRKRVSELENELESNERQADKRKQEYRERLTTLETRLFDLEQQLDDLQSAADGWKVKYEKQREMAEEYLKMVDDREMEGHLAVNDLNESMSEESAERSRHLVELKDECDQLRQKVTEAEAKRDEYAGNFAEVTQRLSKLAAETFKLRNELKSRDEAISILQNESKGHQRRADEAEEKRGEAAKVARDLRDLVATEGERLKDEIKKVTEENKKVTEDCQKAAKENLKWQNEARRLDTMVTVLELKEKEWQQQMTQQKQENVKVTNELYEMTRTVMNKDDEVTEVRTQLKSAAEEYQKLEREVTQLAEHINKMEQENEKVMKEKTFQLHDHTQKVKQENTELRREREELTLRNRRLEDENKALQTSVKHKDEQLLQYGVKTATVESPPPSYTSAVKGPAKGWFEGEKDIASEDGIEYTVKEWMDKFKDEYGDRDEEVLGLREAYARKFELGKESLDQYYQAMMRFKAKRIITEKQAVGFLIEGCKGDNELYKALRIQKCKTPTDVKDFFRHWATGDEKYKAPKGQRNQEYVTIRQGQVENVPQQRMVAASAQQQMEFRAETPVREVTKEVTFIDSQTGQPITYAMVAAIQAAAQVRPPPQNVAPPNVVIPRKRTFNSKEMAITEMETAAAPRITAATAVVATAAAASEQGAEAMAAGITAVIEAAATEVAKETTTMVVVAPKIMAAAKITEADGTPTRQTKSDNNKEMCKALNKEVRQFRETGKIKEVAKCNIKDAYEKNAEIYNKRKSEPNFKVGDLVLIRLPKDTKQGKKENQSDFKSKYDKVWKILSFPRTNEAEVIEQNPKKEADLKVVSIDRLKLWHPPLPDKDAERQSQKATFFEPPLLPEKEKSEEDKLSEAEHAPKNDTTKAIDERKVKQKKKKLTPTELLTQKGEVEDAADKELLDRITKGRREN